MGYAQTYKAFRSVLNDLMTLTGMHPASDKEPEFAIMAADVDVEQYQAFLLTKSTSFQYFSTLFIHDGIDSTAFCAQHGITIRTLRRLITPFRKYLQTYNIDIDPVDGTMAGDELRILFMLHEFFLVRGTVAARGRSPILLRMRPWPCIPPSIPIPLVLVYRRIPCPPVAPSSTSRWWPCGFARAT